MAQASIQERSQARGKEESWIKEIREKLSNPGNPCTNGEGRNIFKVPHALLKGCKEAYIPELVSFGPYHFGCDLSVNIGEMEDHKASTVQSGRILQSLNSRGCTLDDIVHIFEKESSHILSCYGLVEESWSAEKLALVMTLDATFLLEWMHTVHDLRPGKKNGQSQEAQVGQTFIWEGIVRDLVKLENQIPYFVMEKIFDKACSQSSSSVDTILKVLVLTACAYLSPFAGSPGVVQPSGHILESLHTYIVGSGTIRNENPRQSGSWLSTVTEFCCWRVRRHSEHFNNDSHRPLIPANHESSNRAPSTTPQSSIVDINPWGRDTSQKERLPSAVELSDAGVRFIKCSNHLRGIKFDEKTCSFHIPQFIVNDKSEIIMKNLIALEICSPSLKGCRAVTSYSYMMNALVQSKQDVKLLKKNRIITTWLGSDEKVVGVWKSLTKSTMVPIYDPIDKHVQQLVHFYNTAKYRRYWGEYKRKNCSKPWLVVSGVAAALLLFMSLLQLFCTFYDSCSTIF